MNWCVQTTAHILMTNECSRVANTINILNIFMLIHQSIVFTNAPCTQKENDSYTLQAVQFLPSTYRTMSLLSLQFEKLVEENLHGCLLNFLFSYRQHSQIVYQKCVENIHKYVRHSHKSSVTSTYYFQIHLNISLG